MYVRPQTLVASGWRPGCAAPHLENIEKTLPPVAPAQFVILQSPTSTCDEDGFLSNKGYDKWMAAEVGGLHVTTGAFFQAGVGSSCAWVRRPDCVVYTQSWVPGRDECSTSPPAVLLEASVIHALSLVGDFLKGGPELCAAGIHSGACRRYHPLFGQ